MTSTGAIVAAARLRKERELVRHLREQRALSADRAVVLEPQRRLRQSVLRGLLRRGAVVSAGADHYWLHEEAYATLLSSRRRRAFIVMALIAFVALVAVIVMLMNAQR